ncbi:MAG: putative transporter [Bacteroidales bacterium]|nr:putative transporter [Bacteroidales bacterium]
MWFVNLFTQPSVAQSILLVSLVIAIGIALSRIKFGSISLGVTWVLFVGILLSHFGLVIDATTSHFIKEFGLILFIFSIGLEVGPGFFSSFKQGGVTLNLLAVGLILLGSATAYVIHLITGEDLNAMIGVLYGAVTNTPGLGAAQQTFSDMHNGETNAIFAQGYAVAYPLGVVGIILSIVLLRYIFRIKSYEDEHRLHEKNVKEHATDVEAATLEVTNTAIEGHTIRDILSASGRKVVITRIKHANSEDIEMASAATQLHTGDRIYIVATPDDIEAVTLLLGRKCEGIDIRQWSEPKAAHDLISARIVVTNSEVQGRRIKELGIRENLHVTISRVKRAGIDLIAQPNLYLQMGDRLTVVGSEHDVRKIEQLIGNSIKRLDTPQLFVIFFGIVLGVILGSLPIFLPGMPVPVKLGLAGGPLIVSILLSRFGPKYHLVTYTTNSVKLLMREMGICLFMASVGLGAGQGFVETVLNGGLWWILYGFIITFVPCIVIGIIARICHRSYFTIAGLISGATTDPPALAYSNSISGNDQASVAYATVYPLSMFMRVLVAQILVLMAL